MKVQIEHRVGVQAPAETIWAILADINGWPAWSPLYTRVEGALKIGAQLTVEVALAGRRPQTLRPVILDWIPNEQIHWRLSALAGLVKTTRYLEIERLNETGCIFANGELFDGPLGPRVARSIAAPARAGFRAMGEALKERAEAAWRQTAQAHI